MPHGWRDSWHGGVGSCLFFGRTQAIPVVLVATLGLGALGIATWMRPLAGKPWQLGALALVLALALGAPLAVTTVVAVLPGGPRAIAIAAWSAVIVAAAVSTARSLWRFNARPHPFLTE